MKKSFIFILIALVCLFTACDLELRKEDGGSVFDEIVNEDGFKKGDGTEENPYIISTTEQFMEIGDRLDTFTYYKLGADIIVPVGTHFGEFRGVIDGDGYSIIYEEPDNQYEGDSLFWSLMDGTVIRNLDIHHGRYATSLAYASQGSVLFENINVYGDVTITGNNEGTFLVTVGYCKEVEAKGDERLPANVTFRNCTNYANFIDPAGVCWGVSPFLQGMAMPNATEGSTLTLENCVNKGRIEAGKVGFAAGNQSRMNLIDKITITNCRNEDGGYVKGFMDAGDVSWNEKANGYYQNAVITDSENLTEKAVYADFTGSYTASGNITLKGLPEETSNVSFTGAYYLEGYFADKVTISNVHMTRYIPLAEEVAAADSTSYQLEKPLLAGDATAITGEHQTGEVVGDMIYIGNEFHGASGTEYACLMNKSNMEHTAYPTAVYATCYSEDGSRLAVIALKKI